MSVQILSDVKQFLSALEAAQDGMRVLFSQKLAALTHAHSRELLRLAQAEVELAKQLQTALRFRQQILQRAQQVALPADSIERLTDHIAGAERDALKDRIDGCRNAAARLRHESSIHWIIAHRGYNHHTELLDLIAHCGQAAPTYSNGPNRTTTGGAILDASI